MENNEDIVSFRPTAPNINAQIHAPFDGLEEAQMRDEVFRFIQETSLNDYHSHFLKGAFLAQNPKAFSGTRDDDLFLKDDEAMCLEEEKTNRWKHPRALWQLVALCAVGAAVQGWDESAVDGAQTFYIDAFGITENRILIGFVASAPYLCCVFSCWLTQPLNTILGRRGTIFFACIFSSASCLAQAFSSNWQMMVGFRILLGLGFGPKSATIPIYASECAPAHVRGALVMFWQFFTAFGIMMGYICGAAFRNVLDGTNEKFCPQPVGPSHRTPKPPSTEDQIKLLRTNCSLNWRLMIAAPMVAPVLLAMYIYTQPESPRWLLAKAHKTADKKKSAQYYDRVFQSLKRLRNGKLLAARDMILIHYRLLKEDELRREAKTIWCRRGVYELFSIRRNRRAVTASLIVIYVLQLADYKAKQALLWSLGVGIINFLFALPAFKTIDTFGRRNLLLVTFPFLALFQLLSAIAFMLKDHASGKTGLTIAGLYLFAIAYSPGEGPVPFVYAAESMPLYIRDLGMGLATSVLWLFYFLIGVTWPSYVRDFKSFGAFLWYSVWCIIGFFLIYFFVPETKGKELEDLDKTFNDSSTYDFARFHWRQGVYAIKRYVLRCDGARPPRPLITDATEFNDVSTSRGYAMMPRNHID